MKTIGHAQFIFKVCLFSLCLFLLSNQAFADIFAQLSSLKTQKLSQVPQLAILEHVDQLSGLTLSHNSIIVEETGSYFIMANAQVGSLGLGANASAYMSLIRNGKIIPNSIVTLSVNQITPSNLISQTVLKLHAGDAISIKVSSSLPIIGLIATEVPFQIQPNVIPSIIFSMYKTE